MNIVQGTRDRMSIARAKTMQMGVGAAAFSPLSLLPQAWREVDYGLHTTPGSAINLLTWSENPRWTGGVPWTASNCTVSYEATIGQGGVFPTAWLLTPTGAGAHIRNAAGTVDGSRAKICSVYAKRGPGHNGTTQATIYAYSGTAFYSTSFVPATTWTRHSVLIPAADSGTLATLYLYPDEAGSTQPVYFDACQIEYGTTPTAYIANGATVGAAEVLQWLDQSGNGRHYIRSSEGSPTFEANYFNEHTGYKATGDVRMDALSGFGNTTGAITYVVFAKCLPAYDIAFGSWGMGDGSAESWQWIQKAGANAYLMTVIKSGGSDSLSSAAVDTSLSHAIGFVGRNAGTCNWYVDGVGAGSNVSPTWFLNSGNQFKINSTQNVDTVYEAAELWFNYALSVAEMQQLHAYLLGKYS